MIIDCIADLHGHYPKLEGGDLLIVAGDITADDKAFQYIEFFLWLDKQDYRKKIFIGGNHDNILKKIPPIPKSLPNNVEYLCDSGTEFEEFTIWGSPWTPWFSGVHPKCKAFMNHDEVIMGKWVRIPQKIDILITHGPAYGVLDGIPIEDGTLYHAGSHSLYGWLKYVERPRLHVFGHIHEAYGQEEYFITYEDNMTLSVNCSHVNGQYEPVNKPIRVIL